MTKKIVRLTVLLGILGWAVIGALAAARTSAGIEAQGPFLPSWESLKNFRPPQWYMDGKFGIFIHWGVYSVPAFGSEWYPRQMYLQGSAEFKHHVATYGPQNKFGYKDFIPLFKAEKYDPKAWAELFKKAGAKFVVPVAEHHDGFPMYDSALGDVLYAIVLAWPGAEAIIRSLSPNLRLYAGEVVSVELLGSDEKLT
jgi:hypothetical protein